MRPWSALFIAAGCWVAAGCASRELDWIPPETTSAATALSPDITVDDLRTDVAFLASDECDGRLTGTPGVLRAAQYIAAAYQRAGLTKAPGLKGYDQPFEFTAGVRLAKGKNRMEILASTGADAATVCKLDEDFTPLAFSGNGLAEGEVVFVGYGLVEPGSGGKGYDSYAGQDVTGKVVLALRYLPEDITPERRQELSLVASMRYRAKLAADRGAKGFLMVTGPNSPKPGRLLRLRTSSRTSPVSIPVASITGALADRLLAAAGTDLGSLQTMLDGGQVNPHTVATVPGLRVRLNTQVDHVRKSCRNVVGLLPPTGGCDEYIVVGAHYDHIGHGENLGSMARQGEENQVHNGADDNASGTSVVLELAGAIAEARRQSDGGKPQRGIIFACWSGEELGLIGSSHFVSHPPIDLGRIKAYYNFDMVGRVRDNKLIMQAVGSSPAWRRLIERKNVTAGFDLVLQNDPYLPTDATAFYTSGVPGLAFFTDIHEDYNRPTDDPDTLNYDDMHRIAKFARRLIDDTARDDFEVAYARVERAAPKGTRGGHRAYTGTIPDMASSDVEGVKLSDVRPGGPADQAGMKGGDIIVEFAGQKIANLQDYSDALIGAKVGQATKVVVLRAGQRIELTITPSTKSD
ncbi:MAG: M28 family peptidase [bacterium]|nr:M28 family peptidase [bacterium]